MCVVIKIHTHCTYDDKKQLTQQKIILKNYVKTVLRATTQSNRIP